MVNFRRTHYRISLRYFFARGSTGRRGVLARGAYWPEGLTGQRGLLARGAHWSQGEALAPVASPLATPLGGATARRLGEDEKSRTRGDRSRPDCPDVLFCRSPHKVRVFCEGFGCFRRSFGPRGPRGPENHKGAHILSPPPPPPATSFATVPTGLGHSEAPH